ncbi:ras-related protein RABC2a-like [Impatiens glandulifera]|uniref:ras-related protein RABC2a-like n=1 Tax=Impatiens glandulifera TaxID=253017 RepID=UPI001FB0C45C|nr:ras-related protein RABC2a-like [Impatiens glandulifera]
MKSIMGSPTMGKGSNCVIVNNYDYSFKILLIGDSGVGKSSLLLTFVSTTHSLQDLSPTVGVDFKMRQLTVAGKKLKLTFWDTAGQERFGTLVGSYYRGAHAIILVYDVTRRETFTNLSKIWAKEADKACANQECVKILVGNKVDMDSERRVSRKEGMSLAEEHKCLFFECSAKTRDKVDECFRQLIFKILEKPSLLEKGSVTVKRQIWSQKQVHHERGCCS